MELLEYLKTKPLPYEKKTMDYSRMQRAFNSIDGKFKRASILIHIVGTNGKGSTGRTIAHLCHKVGLKVGHYSSPHIFKFNERFWLNGEDIGNKELEIAHKRLYSLVKDLETSYFEYTTLLGMFLFGSCDIVVLEAGLGGEFDATNVCSKDLSIITPIGLDHQKFLGNSVKDIASTKINSIEKKAIISIQKDKVVYRVAKEIALKKGAKLYFAEDKYKIEKFEGYLQKNISLALESLDILDIKYNIKDLESLELFGRFYLLKENIRIDVGHNLLAAEAIFNELKENTILIYNSLEDKPYREILKYLKPKIKKVEIINLRDIRSVKIEELEKALEDLDISYSKFENIDNRENYLVFGSFFVVQSFLERFYEREN